MSGKTSEKPGSFLPQWTLRPRYRLGLPVQPGPRALSPVHRGTPRRTWIGYSDFVRLTGIVERPVHISVG